MHLNAIEYTTSAKSLRGVVFLMGGFGTNLPPYVDGFGLGDGRVLSEYTTLLTPTEN